MVCPSYSLDLAQYNIWLFPILTCNLRGQFFKSDEEVIHKIQKSLTRISEAEFHEMIEERCVERLEQCIVSQGRYFEKDGGNPNNSKCEDDGNCFQYSFSIFNFSPLFFGRGRQTFV